MVQLLNKTIKRAATFFFAAILLVSTLFAFAGCQSSTPKVTLTINFNNKNYSISYKLYRKFFPQTVQHFIELADAGYYNDLCFHDYQEDTGMFTGGYTYNAANAGDEATRGLEERKYFSWLEEKGVQLTQSVYAYSEDGTVPTKGLNTVVGEFEQNNYKIQNNEKRYGAKKDGALVMYYTPKADAKTKTNVTVKRNTKREETDVIKGDARWYDSRDYAMNSATSLFYISFKSEASVNKQYCVFGELYNEEAEETYDALMDAIEAWTDANVAEDDEDGFVEETEEMLVDTEDFHYAKENLKVSYKVPASPIIVKKVKVNRY